jgi:hypothetical protein
VHSLGVKNADAILAAFKFTWLGLVLLVVSRPLHHVDGTDLFSLLVVALGWAMLVRVARLLLLLSGIKGHFLSQGKFVGDIQHLFKCPGVLKGELANQRRVPESLLEEHNNRFVINLQNEVSLVAKALDEVSEWFSLLLDNAEQVPLNSWSCTCGTKVVVE